MWEGTVLMLFPLKLNNNMCGAAAHNCDAVGSL